MTDYYQIANEKTKELEKRIEALEEDMDHKYKVIINAREDFLKLGKNTYIYEDVSAVSYNDTALILWTETSTIYIRMKWLYSFEIKEAEL